MDGSSKIALAIVGGVLAVIVATIGYKEFDRQRAINQINEGIQVLSDQTKAAEAQSNAQAAYQRQREWDKYRDDLARRTLSSNQRCYAGAVVEVHGNTYTQLGTISNPIHCSGMLADHPLR